MGGAGGAVAAGGSGVMFSGTAVRRDCYLSGGCGPPVGVLTTATPMGVAVAGAGGGASASNLAAAVAFGSA